MREDPNEYASQVLHLVRAALASGRGSFGRSVESIDLDESEYPDTQLTISWRSREGVSNTSSYPLWDGGFNERDDPNWMAPEAISNMIVTNFDEP